MKHNYYFRIDDRSLLKVIRDDKKCKTKLVLIDTLEQIKDTVLYDVDKNNIESINDSLKAISDLANKDMMGSPEKNNYLQKVFKSINKLDVQKFVNESVILLHSNESQIPIDNKRVLVITKELEDGKPHVRVKLGAIPLLGSTLSARYAQVIIDEDYDVWNEVLNATTMMVTGMDYCVEDIQEVINHFLIKLRDESFVTNYYNMFRNVSNLSLEQELEQNSNSDVEQISNNNVEDEDEKLRLAKILDQLNHLDMIDTITLHFKED